MRAKTWIGWGLTIAGALAAGPLVLGRGNPSLSHARETISDMSKVEREILDRKYREYRALSETQRSELRKLHQQLEDDHIKGPRYLKTMNQYCDWLKTIDAWQQDELAHLDQPQKKAERVADIVKERAEVVAVQDEELEAGFGPFRQARLNAEQLTKVFDVLTKRVQLSAEEQQQVDKLRGFKRFGVQARFLREKGSPNLDKLFRSITEAELAQMAEESGNAELKKNLAGPGGFEMKRKQAIGGITKSFWDQSIREAAAATEDQLRTHFATLPPAQQDELLQLRSDQFKFKLRMSFLVTDPDIAELKNIIDKEAESIRRRNKGLRGGQGGNKPPRDMERRNLL